MKLHTHILLFISLCCAMPQVGKSQDIKAIAAPNGIWVSAKAIYMPGSSIIISRRDGNNNVEIATLTQPSSLDVFRTAYQDIVIEQTSSEYIADTTLAVIWNQFTRYNRIDSLGLHAGNLHILAALGVAFFDAVAQPGVAYTYQATQNATNKTFAAASVSYPQKPKMGKIRPSLIQPTAEGVYLEFVISNPGDMRTCKVFRSYYMRTKPEEINPLTIFTTREGTNYVVFTDYTAVPKVPYTYTVVPVDAAGNMGDSSLPAILFNVPSNAIPPSVRHLTTASVADKKAIRLSWLPPASSDVISTELYRSESYEGVFTKIASMQPGDTVFMDYDVTPVKTYYYTAAINGTYEKSVNTPRIPGILRASNKNHFAPLNIAAVQKNGVVKLSWENAEEDTRGYYLYRCTGYQGELKRIGTVILSANNAVSYIDTLPVTMTPAVYSYAVSSENTSYEESPLSQRANVQVFPAANATPIAANVSVIPADDGKLRILWDNFSEENNVAGYMLYRSVADDRGKQVTILKPILTKPLPGKVNFFVDEDVKEGYTYTYAVKLINDKNEEGSISKETAYTIPINYPLQVSDIKALSSEGIVKLIWNIPQGYDLKNIQILRAETNEEPKLLADLQPKTDNYTDKDVKKGGIYHYYFISKSVTGYNSEPTVPVSISVD